MPEQESHTSREETIKSQVSEGIEEAKQFAKSLNLEEAKNGEWFLELLRKVVYSYDRNARAEYFQQKYPGLSPDEIADILTSVTTRYATVAGGLAGAAATASQIATLGSWGMTASLFVGTIGAEMIYLARIQMRLVLDLSVVYDLQLDPEDPEDVLMVFGYALGVAPTDLVGRGARKAAGHGTEWLIKKYISKGVLEAIQRFAKKLGLKILQRTIIKYTVPVASAAVGSTYNYITTKSMGEIAKAHFRNRHQFTEELQGLVSRRNTYDLVFPAATMYMAHLDGELSPKERELYKAMLSRMSFTEHTQVEFKRFVDDEANLIEAAAGIDDIELRRSLMDVLILMAVCDGELDEKERRFLVNIAGRLEVSLNLEEVEKMSRDYRETVERGVVEKTASSVKDTATMASGKVKGFGKVLKRTDAEV
ncbi:TerB family tellurite resistance protein [Rubrobacter aplysinae]|uniref:TerB family tellurite resistance protein n=1 Tax=Rubrobacter aplysinae TaxID=909625 RepID=UPI00064C359F|nr:TerB family tellurite resistance protein [Rubrobacter aplysinae]